ncbi:hypothetical protein HK103_003613 [Boothiomyces macroporosus]|uniref:Uncharacterized protein n=1 Tax=Boothiomyces macroporosus TaxID=261099 RepID=A0AAD5ULF8_9FUNG|nr:hypothetical protein HK103_003613 [Boothiomyces macroporosus]
MTGVSLSEFTTTFKEDEINMGYMRYNGRAIFVHYIPAKESDRGRAYSLLHAKKCTQQFFPLISAKITLESLQQFDANFVKDTLAGCEPLKGKKTAADVRFTIMATNQGLNELLNMSDSNQEFAQLMEKKEQQKQSAQSSEQLQNKPREISTSVVKERDNSASVVASPERTSVRTDIPGSARDSNTNTSMRESESKIKEKTKKSPKTDLPSVKIPNFQAMSKGSLSSKSSANNSSEKMNSAQSDVDDKDDHKSMQMFWDGMKNKLAMEQSPTDTNRLKTFVTKSAAHAQNIFGRSSSSESLKGSKAANAVIAQHKQKQTAVVPNELIKFPKASPLNALSKGGSAQSLPNMIEISVEPPSPSKDPKVAPIVFNNDQVRLRRHSADKQMILKSEELPKPKPTVKAMPFKSNRTIGKSLEDINIDDLLMTPPTADFPDENVPEKEPPISPNLRRTKTESGKKSKEQFYFRDPKKLPDLPTKNIAIIMQNNPVPNVNRQFEKKPQSNFDLDPNEESLESKPTITKSLMSSKTVTASTSKEKLSSKEEVASRDRIKEKNNLSTESISNRPPKSDSASQDPIPESRSGLNSKSNSMENLKTVPSRERLNLSNTNLTGKSTNESPKDELRRTPTVPKNPDVVFNIHKGGQLRSKSEITSPSSTPSPMEVDKLKTRQIQLHEQWVQYQAPNAETVEKRWIRLQKGCLTLFLNDKEVSPLLHISLDQPSDVVDCAYGKYPGICLQAPEGSYRFYSTDEKNSLKRIMILAKKWA